MSKIRHIKPFYAPRSAQNDLLSDGLIILGMNITGNFMHYNNRYMTRKEIDNIIKMLYDSLINVNKLKHESRIDWNQTS